MSQHTSLTNTKAQTSHDGSTMLHGRWPLVAHMAWLIAVGITVGVAIAGLPQVYVLLQTVCTQEQNACTLGQLAAESANQLNALGLSLKAYALGYLLFTTAMTLVWWLVAAVIFWRKGNDWLALLVALTLVLQGANSVMELLYTRGGVYLFLSSLGYGLLALVLYLFPDGRFAPRWMRWVAMVLLGCLFVVYLLPASSRAVVDTPVAYGVLVSSIMVVQVYRYRQVSSAVERQQTKWVVFGVVVYASGIFGLVLFPFGPLDGLTDLVVGVAVLLFALFISLSFGMAVLRSRLWDIDLLINRTLVYTTLTWLLAVIFFSSIVVLQPLLRPLVGTSSELATVASTLGVAVLFSPLRRRVQAVIDRRFYRQKYDAQQTLQAFRERMRDETDLAHISDDLVTVVQDTMQPAHVSLWLGT